MSRTNRTLSGLCLLGATCAACSNGTGSDIGPRFTNLPEHSSKVEVLDDQGRGVVEAAVSLIGGPVRALTGRNGRGDLLADTRGRLLVSIDGSAAAAASADELGTLVVAMTSAGGDLIWPWYLPDVHGSSGTALTVGTQASTTLIDDSGTSGARLSIASGSSLGIASGGSQVAVRTGSLLAEHLPGDLPTSASAGQAILLGRGIYVDPPAVTFTPGATLDVVDDLLLGAGTASLYHLDTATGEWREIATGITSSGGRLTATGEIDGGGLYAFGTPVVAGTVMGRIVDASTAPIGLSGMAVTVDGRRATTAGDGTFVIQGVPATTADAAVRSAVVEVFAGGSWLPARATGAAVMNGTATVDVGSITLDTLPAGNLRVQLVRRGRAESLRRTRLSCMTGSVAQNTLANIDGQAIFEDVPSRWFGFQEAYTFDSLDNYYSHAVSYMEPGARWLDAFEYYERIGWLTGARRTRVLVIDATGGGPLYNAPVVRGSVAGAGLVGFTREAGLVFDNRPVDGQATATFETTRDGRTVSHAFSIVAPDGEHIEMPMQQALRVPLGAFDRHAIVTGTLVGANAAREHRLRSTRRLEPQEWWEELVEGGPPATSVPLDIDPATTHGAFRTGLAAVGGHLVAAELLTSGPTTTLQKIGVVADLVPTEGAVTTRNILLDLPATTTFVAPTAVTGLDASIAVSDLTLALLLEQPSGRGIDVVRGINGNHTAVGADLHLQLPALTGSLAQHFWRVLVQGSSTSGGVTITQRSVLRLAGTGTEPSVPLLAAPVISQPGPAATVPAAGFDVDFTLPGGSLYATIALRNETGGNLYLWDVVLPPTATSYTFRVLPTEATTPLVAGKTYSLTVSAYRALTGPLPGSLLPYSKLTAFYQTIGALERGVDAVSSRTIQVTAN